MSDERHVSPFEQIRHETEDGGEYWSARELSRVLGYLSWRNFEPVIDKAEAACSGSGHAVQDHFAHTRTLIETGKGARREVEDVQLSRYACYLVVQNADPEKEIVALGQTYFAVQTRRAELGDELAGLSEAQRRLYIRGQVADHNKRLAEAAQDAGVVTTRDFAIFQDHGYMGLYSGERARDIHARKSLKKGQQILDWMDSEELAANLFRATQTEAKLRREETAGKEVANQTHYAVGREVRETIKRLGGTMPEDLPTPGESTQQLRKREEQAIEARRQPSLFAPEESE
jgi:DNA-damage-inducible protein D